jgi:hypothetical protein
MSVSDRLVLRRPLFFLSAVALLFCVPLSALADDNWQERKQEKGITVYSQKQEGSGAANLKGILYLPFSVDDAANVLMDIPNQITFIPFCKTIQVIEEESLGTERKRTLVYQLNELPVVNDRDMVLETLTWSETKKSQRIWRSEFRTVLNKGPSPTRGIVRIKNLMAIGVLHQHRITKALF